MSKKTDNNLYTLVFAVIMVLVVGSVLAFFASSLKPNIDENKRVEKQQNILYALGVNDNDESNANFISSAVAGKKFEKYIKKQIVIQGDNITEDANAYLIDVKQQQTFAKEGKERKLPLFVGEKDGKILYVAPIYGKGLWDAIWGYVAMDENMIIQGAYFDHKGETPGLGANIKQRFFMDDFHGEHLLTDEGEFKGVTVAKGNNDPKNERKSDYKVDAIAGATITGNGVSAMIKSDLQLYVPYFKSLKN
ncbi:MAG: Na(+)-translocating NADH-quinone reductase subunit C [Flavobacteriia bacterium]|nr:Na(+)-translocating NADH-quinone reductase subunit C [Flavobacteriia bacterium]OIP45949.1 MAG: Na(+)-translocating NADH-quinone reductase subunit C [Flavobacteriaceae bacterium CG2_30_31_66]PIV95911.1 MAG: Na(+)-translocating NADH-quinone reductase subunit C [Flavobacteriaceae bacterium CG17_big_fil_post_rev_8_21_14_2_50_31_13]PIX15292.1 MAG: Na(+)-translocating NADH-quinone reductase subunit C [Flavobacteriaceae bacterium CG_4_8_14_3_um_filter_31_8]PIY15396.1 MAG: Na(+)-translocating NADH-q